ncbi:MAG: DUF3375 family protein [Planctomycetes bacterium]|nr:DUF3375 family protein [Planctomycetota bacterium]
MRREELLSFFDHSPTARLLRSDLGAWVIAFLYDTFKASSLLSILQSDLKARLKEFQNSIHATYPSVMPGTPERYLTQWTQSQWIRRFVDSNSSEPQFQLSPYAEEAIRYVEDSITRRQQLVGTESRLRLIIDTLSDIVRGSSDDPERRLALLQSQRDAVQREIDAIEAGDRVHVYRPSQIRERFQTAIHLLRELQSDFRDVEDRFQQIARRVQQLKASGGLDDRSSILGYALDAEEALKHEDEGISFYAFVRFLLSPTEQSLLRDQIQNIQQLQPLMDQTESLDRLGKMVPCLLAEADKVMRTTARLSSCLRRLLDSKTEAHRTRLTQVLADIRNTALLLRESPPEAISISIEAEASVQSPLSRPFWAPQAGFDSMPNESQAIAPEQIELLASAFQKLVRLDMRKLRHSIREATLEGSTCSLKEMIERSTSRIGIAEILGFLQIAHDDSHNIDFTRLELITLHGDPDSTPSLVIRVPAVLFQAKARNRDFARKPR